MHLSLFILATLLAGSLAAPAQGDIKVPQKCEDVLSVKVCNKLYEAAKNLHLKANAVKDAVEDAVATGKQTAAEIYEGAKDFLKQQVLNKKCEDFIDAKTCVILREFAAKLKIKAEKVDAFVKEAILDGAKLATDVYKRVVEIYKTEIADKTCRDFLAEQHCANLEKVAKDLKLKSEQLQQAIREAAIKGFHQGKELVENTLNNLKDLVKNTKCEDLLNPDLCKALKDYGDKVKVEFPKLVEKAKDFIIQGYGTGKVIVERTIRVFDALLDCEDFMSKPTCDKIKSIAAKLGATAAEVDRVVRDLVKKGINKASEIYTAVLKFIKDKIFGRLGAMQGARVTRSLEKRDLSGLLEKMKTLLEKGINEANSKLNLAIEKVLDAYKIADEKIRQAITDAVMKATDKYNELKKKITEYVKNKQDDDDNVSYDMVQQSSIEDLREQLKQALKQAHGLIKTTIEYLLNVSNTQLEKLKNLVLDILQKVMPDSSKRSVDDEDETEFLQAAATSAVIDEVNKIFEGVEDYTNAIVDQAIEESVEAIDELDDETRLQKRDLSGILTSVKDKLTQVYGQVSKKMNELLDKLQGLSKQDILDALEKAGKNMIGVAEDVLNKIKEMIKNQQD